MMNSAISVSANIRRGRLLPWPVSMYLMRPALTCSRSVLIEQPNLAATCAIVLSPSATNGFGKCLRGTYQPKARNVALNSALALRPNSRNGSLSCSWNIGAHRRGLGDGNDDLAGRLNLDLVGDLTSDGDGFQGAGYVALAERLGLH